MASILLDYENSKIHCITFGIGKQLLIVFPGYDDRASSYESLSFLAETHRIYIIDLPNHGQTIWGKEEFHIQDFVNIVQLILKKEEQNCFELMGHSFSGRILFLLMEIFTDQLDKMYLLAPDGLQNETFRLVFFFPIRIRKWIWQIAKNPDWWLSLTAVLTKWRILPKHSYTFMHRNLSNPKKRDRLFLYWMSINHFKTTPEKIERFLQKNKIDVHLFLGKYDKIVPPENAIQLGARLENASVHLLEKGHDLVGELVPNHF